MKFVTNSPKIDDNESFKFSKFIIEDDKNSKNSQSKNKSVNNQDFKNFENYLPLDYELSQDLSDIRSIINDRFYYR